MASYRRRGAHAARPAAAPFVAVKRAPVLAARGRALLKHGIRGIGMNGLRTRPSMAKVIAAVLVIGFGAAGFAGGLWSRPSAEPTVQAFLLAWQQKQYQAAAELTTGKPDVVAAGTRSEERRVGKECRSRWSPYH